jgi:hypothetical protein
MLQATELNIGDLVRLNSGSPDLTVIGLRQSKVAVQWPDDLATMQKAGDGDRRRETGTDGKLPFLETLNKHEPNQFCQINFRKRPVRHRSPPVSLISSVILASIRVMETS